MLFNQPHDLRLPGRFPVAQINPHGNGQAKLRRHDFRIIFPQHTLTDKLLYKSGKIPQHIGIILLGLQLCQFRILELFYNQHFPGLADIGVMENITNLSLNHLHGLIGGQGQLISIFLPIRSGKNRMCRILLQYFLHQRVQNSLLIFKMTVKRSLTDTDGACNLRNRGGFKPLHREQLQRCLQNFMFCVSSLQNETSFVATKVSLRCTS